MSVFVKVQNSTLNFKRKRYDKKDDDATIALEKALKKFKKKVKDSKILKTYHEKMYFVKPSEEKRAKKSMSKYRAQQQTLENRI